MSKKNLILAMILGVFTAIVQITCTTEAYASTSMTISPLNQMKVLIPGETEQSSFILANPADNDETLNYELEIKPFSTTDENEVNFLEKENYSQIVNWITLDTTEGEIKPNESVEVSFSISVPEDAPASGQYAAIIARAKPQEGGIITEIYEMAHLVYAEVAGETTRRGSITSVNVPGFLLSGNITGSAMITNEGNVHSQAVHTMQIFPLFSNEEVFTNEENPKKSWIMPGNTSASKIAWEKTPSVGIFHVIYNVEYEGVESNVDKYVIVCPIWLLFLIILAIFLIIFRILSAKKKSRSEK